MPVDTSLPMPALSRRAALVLAAVLFVAQIGLIGVIYKHLISFNCLENWPRWACSGASGTLVSVYALAAALTLFFVLRPAPLAALLSDVGHSLKPLWLNIAGFLIALVPLSLLENGSGTQALVPTFTFWGTGFALLLAGILLFLAPWPRWKALLAAQGGGLAGVALVGLAAPYLATLIRPLWRLDTLADATFTAVSQIILLMGYDIEIYPDEKVIGAGDFFISVAPVCSGIEGIALVTVFATLYLTLFRKELRFPRALLIYPVGIAVSACLNVVRIAVLLIIGLEGSPELAVGGFHSHAGWLMFTLIALGIVLTARTVPALQRPTSAMEGMPLRPAAAVPLRRDENAARILPFAIFMLSAMLAQALSQSPGLVYPLRALAMAAGLALFWQIYRALPWRPSPLALGAGVVVGLAWVLLPYTPEDTSPAHGGLTGGLLLGWMIARGVGTILLVPVIEELFFRDYLESKIKSVGGPILAALITAGLFAVLHDRWAEAFAAGLIFSWVMAQRRQVTDAIAAHAVANAIVFGAALAMGKLHII